MSKECDNCKGAGYLRIRPQAVPLQIDKDGQLIPPALPRQMNSVLQCEICNGSGKVDDES